MAGILSVMDSPHDNPELHRWLRRASESRKPAYFVRTVAEAALITYTPDYVQTWLAERFVSKTRLRSHKNG